MQTRFVILCLGRSGSTHLQSLLDSHPRVRCFGELFSDRAPPEQPAFVHSEIGDPASFLRDLFEPLEEPVVGFKLPMNSIRAHPEAAWMVGEDEEMRIVRLSRRNLLAQLVSRRLQAGTGVSHSIQGDYGGARVRIEPERCRTALERMEEDERELDRIAGDRVCFRIAYEDLGRTERLDELQRFLGVEPEPLRSWFEKLRRRPLSEAIENWDSIRRALRGSRYERFLDEEG